MNNEWKLFLTRTGATVEGESVSHFGDSVAELAAAAEADVIADLSHFGIFCAAGADAQTFLQGQLTNDTRLVTADRSQLSAYCTPKGRILSDFRIFMRDDAYCLRLSASLLPAIKKRLGMYILRSKVTLDEPALIGIGVSGPGVESLLNERLGDIPADNDTVTNPRDLTVVRVPGPHARFEIYGPIASIRELWEGLAASVRPVGKDAWCWLDVRAGIPAIREQTSEAFVPQMVNLHLLNGVSFRKGCYTGQEIVARMQYLGKLKRRMYLAHVDATRRPQPGDELFSPHTESGQGTGKIVEACPAPGGGYDVLAVIQISDADTGNIHIDSESGPPLRLIDLPYPIEAETSATQNA